MGKLFRWNTRLPSSRSLDYDENKTASASGNVAFLMSLKKGQLDSRGDFGLASQSIHRLVRISRVDCSTSSTHHGLLREKKSH